MVTNDGGSGGWSDAGPTPADLADIVAALGAGLLGGADAARAAIDGVVHTATVGLLHAALPPMVHGRNALVRSGAWMRIEALTAEVALQLADARVANGVLAGAVAETVDDGVGRITTDLDYAQGVNSIT